MRIGAIIKQYRDEHGETLRSMAERLGVSHSYVSMLEKGVNNKTGRELAPSIYFFADFARLLGISIDALFAMTDGAQPITIPPQNREKEEILQLIESIPEERRAEALSYLRYLAQQETRAAKGA